MAATVQFSESNGAGETVTDGVTVINFGSADLAGVALVPGTHPIIKGTNSFRKYIRFQLVALNGSTQIDSLGTYKLSGVNVTGEDINTNCPNNSNIWMNLAYATPTNGALIANVAGLPFAPVSNLGIAGSSAGALVAPGYSNYWVLQTATTLSTPIGNVNQKVLAIQYNEF